MKPQGARYMDYFNELKYFISLESDRFQFSNKRAGVKPAYVSIYPESQPDTIF
jgi:hypothetical protein